MKDSEINSIGKLIPHPDVPDEWLISQPVSVGFFDGIKLKFIFQGDLESDPDFLFDADRTIETFLKKDAGDRLRNSKFIYENYKVFQDYYDFHSRNIGNKIEAWKYVHPQEIYLSRGINDTVNIYLQIHCECEWNLEHGLQIVFRNGSNLTRVSGIDGNPTE